MEYRKIPVSGIEVSTIGLGAARLHLAGEKETVALVDYGQEKGVNLIDFGMSYPDGMDHYALALRGRREAFYLQMHFGMSFAGGAYSRNYGLEEVKRSFEFQLDKIGTDYADIGFIHCLDSTEDFETIMDNGVFDYVTALKKAGVIRHLGFASHTVETCRRFLATGQIDLFMFSINMAFDLAPAQYDTYTEDTKNRSGWEISQDRQKLYRECARRGVGIQVMKAFGGGVLLDETQSPFGKALTPHQCIQYALDRPAVLSCLLGVKNRDEFAQALDYYAATEEEKEYGFIADLPHKEMQGSCVYCNHCMPCPEGIDIGKTNKFADLYLAGDDLAREHYRAMAKNATDCVECGLCEDRCPFGVEIRERMRKTMQLF